MNPQALQTLNKAYQTIRNQHSEQFSSLHVVDTSRNSGATPQSTAFDVATQIIEKMKQKVAQ